ncbi:MAG: DUF4287 domain-containing protein [Vicinamibacterales bacterium]
MSFQAYIDNIKAKTGKSPEDFHVAAKKQGLLGEPFKTMVLVAWLKSECGLGHGHAMAIVQAFKNRGWIPQGPAQKPSPAAKRR